MFLPIGQITKASEEQFGNQAMPTITAPQRRSSAGKTLVALLLLLAALLLGVATTAWYWLHRDLPAEMSAAENALFDGSLVAIGVVDVERLVTLERLWFGTPDAGAIPVGDEQGKILKTLFQGPAQFRERLRQAMFSLNLVPDANADAESGAETGAGTEAAPATGRSTLLLWGEFDEKSLIEALSPRYELSLFQLGEKERGH